MAGLSLDGGIALQLALRHPTVIAGAFVMSSFMCDDAAAYNLLEIASASRTQMHQFPAILHIHASENLQNDAVYGAQPHDARGGGWYGQDVAT